MSVSVFSFLLFFGLAHNVCVVKLVIVQNEALSLKIKEMTSCSCHTYPLPFLPSLNNCISIKECNMKIDQFWWLSILWKAKAEICQTVCVVKIEFG